MIGLKLILGFDALLISQNSSVVVLWMLQALKILFSWASATELSQLREIVMFKCGI